MMSRNSDEKSSNDRSTLTTRNTAIISATKGSPSASGAGLELTADNRFFSRNLLLSKFWRSGKDATVIYENVCEGCGYGVFEAEGRLCDFCRYAINGQIKDTANIYENICEQCGEIYSADECGTCLLARLEASEKSPKRIAKPAANRILSGLFGTLKKARLRDKPAKYRKLEIIHNVDGFESGVFRTNETFDLNRICELKRLQFNSENHIYGKLRKSDDHLMNSLKLDRIASANNSKSDPSLHKISLPIRTTITTPSTKTATPTDKVDKNLSNASDKETKFFLLQDSVINWMTSLRSQTHEQHSDDSICNTKSIPSRNFNCCGLLYERPHHPQLEDTSLRSLLLSTANDLDFNCMIESFKRNLMERHRSKRRAIYVKVEDKVGDDRSATLGIAANTALADRAKRNALYENDSDFVNDLLSAFDSFLTRDGDDGSKGTGPEAPKDSAVAVQQRSGGKTREKTTASVIAALVVDKSSPQSRKRQCRSEILKSLFNNSRVFIKRVKLRDLITTIELSKGLSRHLITYDHTLSTFLSAIDCLRFAKLDRDRIMKMYVTITAIGDEEIEEDNGNDRNALTASDETEVMPRPLPTVIISHPSIEEEDIYQPIWKFQTAGNPRESYLSDSYDITADCDSSETEDHSDWETDDEFMFSPSHLQQRQHQQPDQQRKKLTDSNSVTTTTSETITLAATGSSRSLSCQSDSSDRSEISEYQSVCILFSLDEPKLRAIIYNYDRRRSYFAGHHRQYQREKCIPKTRSDRQIVQVNGSNKTTTTPVASRKTSVSNKTTNNNNFIPSCVQAWKFMLLDINYLDDEEDMYVTKDEILNKYKEIDPIPVTTLKKSASEGNLLSIPPDKKKSLGERVISKFHAVGFLNINPRQPKDKKSKVFSKRPESTGIYLDGTVYKYPIFAATLDQVEYSRNYNVPRFVVDCIKIIEQPDLIRTEGLYRASGNKVEIDIVKKSLKERYDVKVLINQDIHTITGLLKQFFRELKTPLISDEIYNKLPPENLADKDNLSVIKEALHEMPCQPKDTLKFLLKHLTVVAEMNSINRMTASNLAIIWGPCILYSSFSPMSINRINTLTKVLIDNFNVIFNQDERLIS